MFWKQPEQVPGLVNFIEGVLWIDDPVMRPPGRVELQAERFGFAHHPAEGDVGKSRFRIAATDITMHTGEPYLFNRLTRERRRGPRRRKLATAFINRERLIRLQHVRV